MTNNVNHPGHYTGFTSGAEVIDIAEHLNFNRGNVLKYVTRAGTKDPERELEDLEKARFYLNREIEKMNNES